MRSSDEQRDRRSRSTSAPLVDRRLSLLARRTIAPLVNRRLSLLPLSLSDLGSLFSLSLSLSLSFFPEMIWIENKSVKLFLGQRSKYWSTGNEFPENFIFRCSQTCGFGGKWFPEIIFTQNKRTLRSILVSYFCYLFFWFYVWCGVVQCGLKFSQNHNCTISHFCDYICGAVYKMWFEWFEVGIFFKFWAFSTPPKTNFSLCFGSSFKLLS